jgi:hypothetical protein
MKAEHITKLAALVDELTRAHAAHTRAVMIQTAAQAAHVGATAQAQQADATLEGAQANVDRFIKELAAMEGEA